MLVVDIAKAFDVSIVFAKTFDVKRLVAGCSTVTVQDSLDHLFCFGLLSLLVECLLVFSCGRGQNVSERWTVEGHSLLHYVRLSPRVVETV